jgi:hypothetical protein
MRARVCWFTGVWEAESKQGRDKESDEEDKAVSEETRDEVVSGETVCGLVTRRGAVRDAAGGDGMNGGGYAAAAAAAEVSGAGDGGGDKKELNGGSTGGRA